MKDLTISSEELREILKTRPKSIFLLDVREPEEFAEERIEGCTLIPLDELMTRAREEVPQDQEIIVYCAHGVRSMHALMGLKSMGYARVRSLTGGVADFYGHD